MTEQTPIVITHEARAFARQQITSGEVTPDEVRLSIITKLVEAGASWAEAEAHLVLFEESVKLRIEDGASQQFRVIGDYRAYSSLEGLYNDFPPDRITVSVESRMMTDWKPMS
jgi:hypothetical protein